MTDLTLAKSYVYITSILPSGDPLKISGADVTSGGDTVQIHIQKLDKDRQIDKIIEVQIPQTEGAKDANERKVKYMKRFKINYLVTGFIQSDTNTISNIDGDATTITLNTTSDHNFSEGDSVTIINTTNYNGTYTVATAPSVTQITITDGSHNLALEMGGNITSATHQDKEDVLNNFYENANNGKMYYLIIPKLLTSGAETATSVIEYPSGTNGISGLLLKLKISENITDGQGSRQMVLFTFMSATDLGTS